MSVESFLSAPCGPWKDDPEDDPHPNDPTWREWIKDVLVTLQREGEGFDGKRPNCETDWDFMLSQALHEHGVTMAEVMAHALDAGLTEPHRLHEPGLRTRPALEGFRKWALATGESHPLVVTFTEAALDPTKLRSGFPRGDMAAVRKGLAAFALLEQNWPASKADGFDCNWPDYVSRYLDEVALDAWKRTDIWRARSR